MTTVMNKTLQLPNGNYYGVRLLPLHRRRRRGVGVYRRTTDWLAQAGDIIAWGRTRREAFARLVEMTGNGAQVIPFGGR
jgi:hypothetical protein